MVTADTTAAAAAMRVTAVTVALAVMRVHARGKEDTVAERMVAEGMVATVGAACSVATSGRRRRRRPHDGQLGLLHGAALMPPSVPAVHEPPLSCQKRLGGRMGRVARRRPLKGHRKVAAVRHGLQLDELSPRPFEFKVADVGWRTIKTASSA